MGGHDVMRVTNGIVYIDAYDEQYTHVTHAEFLSIKMDTSSMIVFGPV